MKKQIIYQEIKQTGDIKIKFSMHFITSFLENICIIGN